MALQTRQRQVVESETVVMWDMVACSPTKARKWLLSRSGVNHGGARMAAEEPMIDGARRLRRPRWVCVAWACGLGCAVTPIALYPAPFPTGPSQETLARLDAVEQGIAALVKGVGTSSQDDCRRLTQEARARLRDDLQTANALFHLVLGLCPATNRSPSVLLDTARTDALIGASGDAAQRFLAASAAADGAYELAPAVEGFVQMAERLTRIDALPPLERYITTVGYHGTVDEAATETLYRLGRVLMRQKDPRAADLLSQIPPGNTAFRRALYVLAAAQLRDGNMATARRLFLEVAELQLENRLPPEEQERDAEVRELAWLATGRLAFEQGDVGAGYFAYQQVLVSSPQFAEAFVELGWLAMEHGNEPVALAAFEPLIHLAAGGDAAQRAALLKGYLLLTRKEYDEARVYYEDVANTYVANVAAFDAAVKTLDDVADLARDCSTRTAAIRHLLLSPVVQRLEVEAARRLDVQLTTAGNEKVAAQRQLEVAEALLTDQRPRTPLKELSDSKKRAVMLLEELGNVGIEVERTASRQTWQADLSTARPPGCCADPADRVRRTRKEIETLLTGLDARETATRTALVALRDHFRETLAARDRAHATLVVAIHAQQQALVGKAIAAVRRDLSRMAMEGDAGVLEAIWRFKEDHREQIKSLELERKRLLDELEVKYAEVLATLEDADGGIPLE